MLKETETSDFFVTFLSLVTVQLRVPAPSLRLWMITPIKHVVAQSPQYFGNYHNIILPNIGEDQKKVLPSERGHLVLYAKW